jgi:hypothetical protein
MDPGKRYIRNDRSRFHCILVIESVSVVRYKSWKIDTQLGPTGKASLDFPKEPDEVGAFPPLHIMTRAKQVYDMSNYKKMQAKR